MNLFELDLVAGQQNIWFGYAKFFRILVAQGSVSVTARYARGSSITSTMLAGIGVDLRHYETGDGFISLAVTSQINQTVKILVSDLPTTDNRLTGEVSVDGSLDVLQIGGASRDLFKTTLTNNTASLLLPAQSGRLKAIVNFKFDAWLGLDNSVTDTTGFKIEGGSDWIDENAGELWVFTKTAGNVVTVLGDYK